MKIPKGLNRLSCFRAKIVYSKKSMKIPKGLNRRAKIVYSKTGELKLSKVRMKIPKGLNRRAKIV